MSFLPATIWCIHPSAPLSMQAPASGFLGFPLFSIPFFVGAPALLIGARRSRDLLLRGSLKLFGVFLLLFFVNTVLSIVGSVVFGVSAYSETLFIPCSSLRSRLRPGSLCSLQERSVSRAREPSIARSFAQTRESPILISKMRNIVVALYCISIEARDLLRR
jgi:hypothetical protein